MLPLSADCDFYILPFKGLDLLLVKVRVTVDKLAGIDYSEMYGDKITHLVTAMRPSILIYIMPKYAASSRYACGFEAIFIIA